MCIAGKWYQHFVGTCRLPQILIFLAVALVLLAKEETILQSMIDKLIEDGRRCGMEINI
jgi:hypothetical protein